MSDQNIKKNVREFYDRVGWQRVGEDCFQNAQYEDLRPVAREYIHRAHMRVKRHLAQNGRFLLDAGSGPVQYPEYLTYSEGYQARVCMDISMTALKEARNRLGDHGLFVVGDVTNLPFRSEIFDGIVSLHTIHHVPIADKLRSYDELYRTLNPGKTLVVVNGWINAPLMNWLNGFMHFMKRFHGWWMRKIKGKQLEKDDVVQHSLIPTAVEEESSVPQGTYVEKLNAEWLTQALAGRMDHQILVWRSVSVPFLRAVFYPEWGGRFWLKVLFWLEERFPHLLGRIGQYPLVVISKPGDGENKETPIAARAV